MKAWRLYARSGIMTQGMVAFGMFIILTNGLFQEEAWFAPLALGLVLAFAGLTFGAVDRRLAPLIQPARDDAGAPLAALT